MRRTSTWPARKDLAPEQGKVFVLSDLLVLKVFILNLTGWNQKQISMNL